MEILKIVKVKKKNYEEITTNHPAFNEYRRFAPNIFEHYLGDRHGWLEIRFAVDLEEAYQDYMRKVDYD